MVSLHGSLPHIADQFQAARTHPQRGRLSGLGFVNEALGCNPIVNDLMSEMAWRAEPPALDTWVPAFAESRYGRLPPAAAEAWRTLQSTAYLTPNRVDSIICTRPAFSGRARWAEVGAPYDRRRLAEAWSQLLACADALGAVDTYRFDLVHLGRHVLDSLAGPRLQQVNQAFQNKDRAALATATTRYLDLLRDMDALLGTREEFLLGRWLADARRWGTDEKERRLYEWNARTLITLWGPRDGILHEYAQRQWSGLLTGFYLPRWQMFFQRLDAALATDQPFDEAAFEQAVRDWEVAWTHARERHPAQPQGDAVALARTFRAKYAPDFAPHVPSLPTPRPTTGGRRPR